MASDWEKREEEFYKINEQIEKRSKEIMDEVETVVSLNKFTANELVEISETNSVETRSKDYSTMSEISSNTESWEGFPEGCQNMGQKNLIQFLKTKVMIQQNNLDVFKTKYKTKLEEYKKLDSEFEKIKEERNKWKKLAETNRDQKEKLTNQLAGLNTKLQTKDIEISSLKRELENIKKDFKSIHVNNSNQDARLNKALEDLDKLKTELKNCRKTEKETREIHKKEMNELLLINKKLEKQTAELTAGFKTQLCLVDNLKKQKMYLETTKITDMIEGEFLKILDSKFDGIYK